MAEQEVNPFESPVAEDPPYQRLSRWGRVLASIAVVAAAVVSFCVCFCAVCFGEALAADVFSDRFMEFFIFSGLGFLTSAVISGGVALLVTRRVARRVFQRDKLSADEADVDPPGGDPHG